MYKQAHSAQTEETNKIKAPNSNGEKTKKLCNRKRENNRERDVNGIANVNLFKRKGKRL